MLTISNFEKLQSHKNNTHSTNKNLYTKMVDRGSFSFVNNLTFIDERVRSHAPISKNQEMPER